MPVGSEPDNTREGVMVMDMGLHAIPTLVEPQQIIQVLIPGVEERARHLPPLMSSSRLMPGEYLAHSCHGMAPWLTRLLLLRLPLQASAFPSHKRVTLFAVSRLMLQTSFSALLLVCYKHPACACLAFK